MKRILWVLFLVVVLACGGVGETIIDPFVAGGGRYITKEADSGERFDAVCLDSEGRYVVTPGEPLPICTKEAEHTRAIKLLVKGYLAMVDLSFDHRWNLINGEIRSEFVLKIDGIWKEVTESEYDAEVERLDKLRVERIAELWNYLNSTD